MAELVPCRPPLSSSKPSSAASKHKELRGLAPIIIVPAAATANINMANAKVRGRAITATACLRHMSGSITRVDCRHYGIVPSAMAFPLRLTRAFFPSHPGGLPAHMCVAHALQATMCCLVCRTSCGAG